MFGKLRLIGRGARPAAGTAPAGRAAAPAASQAPTVEKVSAPKAMAARLLAHPVAWRNALPRLDHPAAGNGEDAPRPAI
jgi:hypothetical protein